MTEIFELDNPIVSATVQYSLKKIIKKPILILTIKHFLQMQKSENQCEVIMKKHPDIFMMMYCDNRK